MKKIKFGKFKAIYISLLYMFGMFVPLCNAEPYDLLAHRTDSNYNVEDYDAQDDEAIDYETSDPIKQHRKRLNYENSNYESDDFVAKPRRLAQKYAQLPRITPIYSRLQPTFSRTPLARSRPPQRIDDIWSGGYLGIIGEIGKNAEDLKKMKDMKLNDLSLQGSNTGFGAFGGINFQSSMFVYGIEADALFAITGLHNGDFSCKKSVNGNLSARMGIPLGNILLYGKLGMGADNFKLKIDKASVKINKSDLHLKYHYGFGADIKLSEKQFLKIEGLADKLYDTKSDIDNHSQIKYKDTSYTLRVGLGYRF